MRKTFSFSLILALAACTAGRASIAPDTAPSPRADWASLMAQVSQETGAGRFAGADRLLTDYATRYPASSEAVESIYWRALYKLDPSNSNASPRDAGVLLDNYLSNATAPHRAEAMTLRRVVTALESRPRESASQPSSSRPSSEPAPADKGKDDEIARLKDELAKANAELDRIKKRLAQPTKP